jgi:hypothetical protein
VVRTGEVLRVAGAHAAELHAAVRAHVLDNVSVPSSARARITERSPIDVRLKSPGSGTSASSPT